VSKPTRYWRCLRRRHNDAPASRHRRRVGAPARGGAVHGGAVVDHEITRITLRDILSGWFVGASDGDTITVPTLLFCDVALFAVEQCADSDEVRSSFTALLEFVQKENEAAV